MGSVIVLSLIIVAAFGVLCYLFNESRIKQLDSLTIAAVEARADVLGPKQTAEAGMQMKPSEIEDEAAAAPEESDEGGPSRSGPLSAPVTGYEYREMLEENGDNYVLPQWMVNFFSSSDICHTLDPADNVLFVVKVNDPRNAEKDLIDIAADCDMSTQTIALRLSFGEGAAAEALRTKFYLFERGDLFELNRLVHQNDLRIDILARAPDYTLEYARTLHARLPQSILSQLKNVLAKIPS
jgi:hypothetical protein